MQVLQILHILKLSGAVLGLALMAGLVLKPGGDLVVRVKSWKATSAWNCNPDTKIDHQP